MASSRMTYVYGDYIHGKPFGLNKNDLIRVVRIRSFLVELSGFEPLASSLRTRRSTN